MTLDFGPCAMCGAPCEFPETSFLAVTVQPSAEFVNGDPRVGQTERFAVCEPCSKRPIALGLVIGAVRARSEREVA